ncbi:DUF1552 domain-containing protein [Gemmata sp. G18]|uniref:DUF1552 domain-containing protein n=1 Tax=Gemmata palustris TaxID=2822762 RepID=A0ABS5BQF3_9BACT|nr:DUF1552 domain-containing protein [Gemmata palustris]MBP3955960.1 DUF1552 domain-containing protein [Gemmata palustris]
MARSRNRRDFIRDLGLSAAALPFVLNLPGLAFANQARRKQRLVILFSPNGVVPETFWPDQDGEKFALKESLKPLEPFRKRMLVLRGLSDKVGGDGDNHMRGMGCLLTGVELNPGNIQVGTTSAGWSKGHSIDQEIRRHLQGDGATKTRFGSLEFGALVPDRADTWTRMVYAGGNKPIAPIDDPHQMFAKLYGRVKDQELLGSVLDVVGDDLKRVGRVVSAEDRRLLEEHAAHVRELEEETKVASKTGAVAHPVPELDPGLKRENDLLPKISKTQIDLMVQSFAADFTRIATLQYTCSVGNARMRWLGIDDQHHELSHQDSDGAKKKLTKINGWFCEQVAYLAKRLADTPEPGAGGSLLDNTLIVWTNELGQGSSHTLDNIPFVLVGNGLDFKMGRSLNLKNKSHSRLLLSLAHGFDHRLKSFGNPTYCEGGPLSELV